MNLKKKEETKWWLTTPAIITGLILFFPVGLYQTWNSDWSKKNKIIATGIIIGLFLLRGAIPEEQVSYQQSSSTNSNVIVTEDLEIELVGVDKYTSLSSNNMFIDPYYSPEGEAILVAKVKVTNNTNEPQALHWKLSDLKIVDGNNMEYSPGDIPFDASMLLDDIFESQRLSVTGTGNSSDLLPGLTRTYAVTYRVVNNSDVYSLVN